ncbi:MAG: hypothetical protein N838_08070 [Thiohalocapsa sp. PB-PSB1]|nr:MAG: hypothetical protein N838_08070 [Thiohalocapsa sp. PB-PSB1]
MQHGGSVEAAASIAPNLSLGQHEAGVGMSGLWQSAAVFALLHCICKLASACCLLH